MTDIEMFRIMGLENSEEWMNQIQHGELIIKRARAFFDSWLERFTTWDLFVQALRSESLPEFGGNHEAAIKQVTDWLGGAAKAAANYAYIVKYGVGENILHRFTGVREATIKAAFPPVSAATHGGSVSGGNCTKTAHSGQKVVHRAAQKSCTKRPYPNRAARSAHYC